MDILFLHQNFPAQFAHLAPALAEAGNRVFALTSRFRERTVWRGVEILPYPFDPPAPSGLHPWMRTMNAAAERGAAVYRAASALRARGLMPQVIVAHSGWGEALYLRHVWPDARIGVFCEFFYRAEGADIGFDPEFSMGDEIGRAARVDMKNLAMRLQLEAADAGLSPTRWQADAHPDALRRKVSVIFDGIDTDAIRPDPSALLQLEGHGSFAKDQQIVTFVNRNLEPYRGFHIFMRALPGLLDRLPDARFVIVGEDGVSYGTPPDSGGSWKRKLLAEIGHRLRDADRERICFTGRIGRDAFTRLLQVSSVHTYLTYPFVLSWSLVEAMSAGCAVAASDTAPVREVIDHGETGLLFDFFDGEALIDRVATLAEDVALRDRLGAAARQKVSRLYDLRRVCLPAQFRWVQTLAGSRAG